MPVSVAVILALTVAMTMARNVPVFDMSRTSRSFRDGTTDRYFRYMMLDEVNSALYVGAMENVYRLNLNDVSYTGGVYKKSPNLPSRDDDNNACQYTLRYEEFECSNHIRVLIVQGDYIYGCGTGSHYPVEFKLHRQTLLPNGTYPPADRDTGMMKCPHTPSGSYATAYVENGNPEGIPSLYSATVSRLTDFKQVVNRPSLERGGREVLQAISTVKRNAVVFKWLNEASFVATFETTQYIYVFFNEIASEFSMMARNVPRVARICKNDKGGRKFSVLDDHWTTFVKVRLNCSLPGTEAFYFDVLRDVLRIDTTYYALFTTPESAINGSAVCQFTQGEIDAAFEGSFMKYGDWEEVEDSDVSDPRPGTCNDDSQSLPLNVVNFIASHPLMYNALSPHGGEPLYYMPQELGSKLIVKSVNNDQYLVFYLITVDGRIHKVAYEPSQSGGQAKHVVTMRPFGFSDPTVYSAVSHGDFLYLSTDMEVKQVSIETCSEYLMCTDCVQDPHCGWSQMDGCVKATGSQLFQSVFGSPDPLHTCGNAGACYMQLQAHHVAVPGDAVHMSCESQCHPNDDAPIQWYHRVNGERIPVTVDNMHKLMLTTSHGLVIFNATFANAGMYECMSGSVLLAAHNVSIPDCDASDQKCIWETEFDRWCNEFEVYKDNYNHWLCAKNQCIEQGNCEPDQISDAQCPMT